MLEVSKSYEISCHLGDNRENFVSRMACVSTYGSWQKWPHSLLHVTVVRMNASKSYNHICSWLFTFSWGHNYADFQQNDVSAMFR